MFGRLVLPLLAALVAAACAPAPTTSSASATAGSTVAASSRPATAPSSASGTAPAWRRLADIPTPRSEVAATVFRGGIYVIGGFGGGRVVERYDPSVDRWSRAPDLPIEVDHAMAAAIDDGAGAGIYAIGGNAGAPTARAFVLVPGATAWRDVARMPGPRSQAAAVPLAGHIYVFGGFDGARLVAPTYDYDVARDAWREVAAIPTPRDHLAGAALLGRACAVGGRQLSLTTNLGALECYDPSRGTWEKLPNAPTPRGGVGAANVGYRLVFVGGEQPSGTYREVEVYDALFHQWSSLPDLPTPRHGIGVVAIDSTVYVMSGGPTPGGSQTPVCEALAFQ
jgi:N-acetylneuraminic acid mutarotase